MIDIRIRDSRDVRGPQCGNVRISDHDGGYYTYASPHTLLVARDYRWLEYFHARLRGAFTTLGELP